MPDNTIIQDALFQVREMEPEVRHSLFRLLARAGTIKSVTVPYGTAAADAKQLLIEDIEESVLRRIRSQYTGSGLDQYSVVVCSPDAAWAMICHAYELGAADKEFKTAIFRRYDKAYRILNADKIEEELKAAKEQIRRQTHKKKTEDLIRRIGNGHITQVKATNRIKSLLFEAPTEDIRQDTEKALRSAFSAKFGEEVDLSRKKRSPEFGKINSPPRAVPWDIENDELLK